MRILRLLVVPIALVLSPLRMTAAEPLQGATAVLGSLKDRLGKTDAGSEPVSDSDKVRADLTNFTAQAAGLAPAAAAQGWLALADRVAALPEQTGDQMPFGVPSPLVQDLIAALPPPEAWDDLAKIIAARPAPGTLKETREFGLRMLALALVGDRPGLVALSSTYEGLLVKAKREDAMQLIHGFRQLDDALLASSEDPKAILAGVERQLSAADGGRDYGYESIRLPDLVATIGETNATPYLRRALLSKARSLSVKGNATEALARKIALAEINDLKVPRWELVNSLDALDLYEAMAKKFAQPSPPKSTNPGDALDRLERQGAFDDFEKLRAKTYYLMALIVRGRTADAAALARLAAEELGALHVEQEAVVALERAGFAAALDDFLFALLTTNPELPYWETYLSVAAKTGQTERMLGLVRAAVTKPALTGQRSASIRALLYRALLAADHVDEGVKELRALLQSVPKDAARDLRRSGGRARPTDWQDDALALARLGLLLEKPEWVSEGLAFVMARLAASPDPDAEPVESYQTHAILKALVQAGRPAQAEKLLADHLARAVKQKESQPDPYSRRMTESAAREALKALVAVYHQAGRPEDVLILLERSPHWGVKDFAELLRTGSSGADIDFGDHDQSNHQGPHGSRLALAAATALHKAGRNAEARTIVDGMLEQAGGDDRAYGLLLELAGPEALPRLEAILARDAFEERPLIWKAVLLHQAGREVEAEQAARQAIAIDPSDGEQGKGDRMRVYAVLADIRAARGDQKEAEVLRGVVRAIRLSERADDFRLVGLLSRAVKLYEESLTHFADAYCIQSRLAVQLSELGQHELAAQHYQRAFELMPESFGRVESHCFGCESTFASEKAQTLAERVFTTLAAKNPNKPQVHYLLGYLRQQQERGREALPHFRRALELDPDYLNAWQHLEQLSQEQHLPVADRDEIFFNMLRLDPLSRHTLPNFENVGDLRRLWKAVATVAKFDTKTQTALLPMPASREAIEKSERTEKPQRNQPFEGYSTYRYTRGVRAGGPPGRAMSQHLLVVAISYLMSMGAGFASTE